MSLKHKFAIDQSLLSWAAWTMLSVFFSFVPAWGQSGTVDPAFRPVVERRNIGLIEYSVSALAVQPDGKILVGGSFNASEGVAQNNLIRLNADGSLDSAFNTGASVNGGVLRIVVQPDGKILLGGFFTTVNNQPRASLARLNPDGSLDTSFVIGSGANSNVDSIVLQPDGRILIGGLFTLFNNVARSGIARLNTDGSLDNSVTAAFNTSNGRSVQALALQPDGRILVGGSFVTVNGVERNGLARLNADGSLDSSLNIGSGVNSLISSFAVQPDGKILIAGGFTEYNGVPRGSIARLNSDGSLDASFNPNSGSSSSFNNRVIRIVLQPDGKVVVGGEFQNFNSNSRGRLARLNPNGTLDSTFVPGQGFSSGFNSAVNDLLLFGDGRILVGGSFSAFTDNSVAQPRSRLALVNGDGTLSAQFNVSFGQAGVVRALASQSDGKVVIGGNFDYVNGAEQFAVARINADGSLDNSFNSGGAGFRGQGFTAEIHSLAVQPDGKILAGGLFATYNGAGTQRGVVRLNADGSLDNSFAPGAVFNGTVNVVVVQAGGRILVGGQFGPYSGRNGLIRLNANGSIDGTFVGPGTNFASAEVTAIVPQPDGKLLLGGGFDAINNVQTTKIARLNVNGAVDTTFTPGFIDFNVRTLAPQTDGKIVIGGIFTSIGGVGRSRLARLNADGSLDSTFTVGGGANNVIHSLQIQPDGKIVIGGQFTSFNGAARNGLARVNSDGSLDSSFAVGTGIGNASKSVFVVSRQADGGVLIGGDFTTFNGSPRLALAKIKATGRTTFDFDGDGRADLAAFRPSNGVWYSLASSNNNFSSVQWGQSGDKLAPADYDGDGRTDYAVFRGGIWYILQSSNNSVRILQFGVLEDLPRPGDFDGDGKAEIAVWRPSNGVWYWLESSTGGTFRAAQFGQNGDHPIIADFDGDAKTDLAVWRASNGTWYFLNSGNQQFGGVQWGVSSDIPVAGDYTGDGKSDFAVWRPASGTWFILAASSFNVTSVQWGIASDKPAAADYDGDGRTDLAVYRSGVWYIIGSANNQISTPQFGIGSDAPVTVAYLP